MKNPLAGTSFQLSPLSAQPENAGTDPGLCSVELLTHLIAGARILSSDSSEVTPTAKAISLRVLMVQTASRRQPTLGVDR